MIEIISPGLATSVQSSPRYGLSGQGIPIGGPMDRVSAKTANQLLKNFEYAPLLECTLIGPQIKFRQNTQIAIAGAEVPIFVNFKEVDHFTVINVRAKDVLSFGTVTKGCRFYISFKRGLKAELFFSSASVSPTVGIGNYLTKKDTLSIDETKTQKMSDGKSLTSFTQSIVVYPGPEYDLLPQLGPTKIFTSFLKTHSSSNRMAYSILENQSLQHRQSILTSPVKPGTVQLTPSGKLIILMRDAQLTGGYPRILQLPEESINSLSQIKPGEEIRFILKEL